MELANTTPLESPPPLIDATDVAGSRTRILRMLDTAYKTRMHREYESILENIRSCNIAAALTKGLENGYLGTVLIRNMWLCGLTSEMQSKIRQAVYDKCKAEGLKTDDDDGHDDDKLVNVAFMENNINIYVSRAILRTFLDTHAPFKIQIKFADGDQCAFRPMHKDV